MKICRFDNDRLGIVEDDVVVDVTHALAALPAVHYPLPLHDLLIAHLDEVRSVIAGSPRGEVRPVDQTCLLSPVANPGKLIAAPLNYEAHVAETVADKDTFSREHVRRIETTGLFLKATSSLIGSGQQIEIHHSDRRTDHEIELAVVIGKHCRGVSRKDALSYVAGYSLGLDITIRGPEERSLRKSLDTYSVLGPWLVSADEFGDPAGREISLSVDGEVRQSANTSDLIMDVPALIEFASSFYTLYPGDVLYTGTPEGVGPIVPGNTIVASISGIGKIDVKVVRS